MPHNELVIFRILPILIVAFLLLIGPASDSAGAESHEHVVILQTRRLTMHTGILEISIGRSGEEIIRTSQVPIKRGQVAELAFFESSDIANQSEPTVRLVQQGHRIEFPTARSVLFTADQGRGQPVEDVDITFKLPKSPKSFVDASALETYDRGVYDLVNNVIGRINNAGWKRYIAPSEPRIAGSETYAIDDASSTRRYIPSTEIPSDPTASLTFEQWKKLKDNFNHTWRWYLDGVFIDLDYKKDPRDAASFPLVENLKLAIQGERMFLAVHDPKQDGNYERGFENYKNSLPRWFEARKKEEAKARAAGLKILEDWVDPPIGNVVVPGR